MAAIAEGVAMGAPAAAHQHRGRLAQPQSLGHPARAQMRAITEPAVMAAAAAAELMHAGRQLKRLWAGSRKIGIRHRCAAHWSKPDPSLGFISRKTQLEAAAAGWFRGHQRGVLAERATQPRVCSSCRQGYCSHSGCILGLARARRARRSASTVTTTERCWREGAVGLAERYLLKRISISTTPR